MVPPPLPRIHLTDLFIDHLPLPAILMRYDGSVRHVNHEARELFGDSLNAVLRHPSAQRVFDRLGNDEAVTIQLDLDVPVRRVVQASFRRLPHNLSDTAHGPVDIVAILTDHSEAEAVNRMRTDFVAHASHELRTPLASLAGFIETLQGPAADDPPAQQQFLAIMAAQAGRMQRLIDRLLYLSRVQRLEHARPRDVVSVIDVMDRLTEETAILMRSADASLALAAPDEEFFFPGDEDQIVQVLLNLVENAVKYGGAGVRIAVGLMIEGRGVTFSVKDDGVGVEARHIPRLTERFYRIDNRKHPQITGTGLGLAIVKHIVDRHGGRLTIRSSVGEGMHCSVWFPLSS